jgi:hypothetical protein
VFFVKEDKFWDSSVPLSPKSLAPRALQSVIHQMRFHSTYVVAVADSAVQQEVKLLSASGSHGFAYLAQPTGLGRIFSARTGAHPIPETWDFSN